MKKNLFPIQNKSILVVSLISFFTLSAVVSEAQCCAKTTSTKSCSDKKNGTATVAPCIAGNYSYLWDDANAQTTPVAVGLSPGVYNVTVSTANLSCPYTVTVTDSSCIPYSVPNVLTPNGDGMNDRFVITGLENGTKVTIYNRWGDVMYSSNDYTNDWEATGLTEGIYFYVLNRPNAEARSTSKNDPSRGFIQILK